MTQHSIADPDTLMSRICSSIAWVSMLVAILALCGCNPSPDELAKQVEASKQSTLDSDTDLTHLKLRVVKIMVVNDSGNKYQGIATVKTPKGPERQVGLQITADGKNMMWKTENGAFLVFAQDSLAELFSPHDSPAKPQPVVTAPSSERSPAFADSATELHLRGGTLTFQARTDHHPPQILFNKKFLLEKDTLTLGAAKDAASVGQWDAVLVMNNSGGTACPVTFFLVSINTNGGFAVSPEFGTCSDLVTLERRDGRLLIMMPKMRGRGEATYAFDEGDVFENGQLIPGRTFRQPSDGDIIINGRGQVLTSGKPSPQQLRCVEDLVDKEIDHKDDWEDRVLEVCEKRFRKLR